MQFLLLVLLPALAVGIMKYDTCDGNSDKVCFDDANCGVSLFTGPVKCFSAPNVPAVGVIGCCEGGSADDTTTSTTTAATTVASGVTTVSTGTCVDKTNPLTGVSDCPARASLCTDSVYLEVMRDQCPKTCNFCSSTGTGTGTNSTITGCLDRVNPSTGVSDCPAMKGYCDNTIYQPLMRIQCPATCGFCTSG